MYIKTIQEFIEDTKDGNIHNSIISVLSDAETSASEKASWNDSLPVVAGILDKLSEKLKQSLEIVLEAQCGIDGKRADVIIVGKKNGIPVVIVLENKRWSELQKYTYVDLCNVIDHYHGRVPILHPCEQVNHYKNVLRHTNKFVQDKSVGVNTAVLLQNATEEERTNCVGPFDVRYNRLIDENPIFIGTDGLGVHASKEEDISLASYISSHMDEGESGLAEKLCNSEKCFSDEYRQYLATLYGCRKNLLKLLDDAQIELFSNIAKSVYDLAEKSKTEGKKLVDPKDRIVYVVHGKPGTGKTFVAEALLSWLLQEEIDGCRIKPMLLLKNRDPRKAMIQRNSDLPQTNSMFIKDSLREDSTLYDCLICDESHRNLEHVWNRKEGRDMRNTLRTAFEQANVTVLFYDKWQHVHVNDYVTEANIKKQADLAGITTIFTTVLKKQHRMQDATRFLDIVECLLDEKNPNRLPYDKQEYEVALVDNPQALFDIIREKNRSADPKKNIPTSRVLAGKGRTNGEDWKWWWDDKYNCYSVGPFRNLNRKFKWNKNQYGTSSFAADPDSVGLVGCIDTSQGLDFEYVGVIIAPDLIYNKESRRLEVCLEGHQQSDPNTGLMKHPKDIDDIKTIIKNTYRVLLSRGRKGCFIYCCDESLQEYLGSIFPYASRNKDQRLTGTVNHIYKRNGTAQLISEAGVTYGVGKDYFVDGLEEGMTVSFIPSGDFASDIKIED